MPEIDRRRTLGDRVGGPNAVTWPGFVILLAIGAVVSTVSSRSAAGPWWVATVVAIAAASTAYAVLALARITVLRGARVRPRPWRTVACFVGATLVAIVVSSIVGGALAAATGIPRTEAATPDPALILTATVGTVVGAVLVMAFAAVVVDAWREYREVARELDDLDRQLAEVRSIASVEAREQDAQVRAAVERLLLAEMDGLQASDSAASAERLRHAALDVVRPLSHDLGLGPLPVVAAGEHRIRLSRVVADATATRLFSPWASALVISVPVLFTALIAGAGSRSPVIAAATFVVVGVLALSANVAYAPRADRASVGTRIAWLLVCTLAVTGLVWAAWRALDPGTVHVPWGLLVVIVPVILLLPAVLTALATARERHYRMLSSLTDDVQWQLARARELSWVRRSTLARALHGPVQSAVLAASIRLDAAARAGSVDEAAVEEARATLQDALTAFTASPEEAVDLAEVFSRLRDMWAGVSEIVVDADTRVMDMLARDRVCAHALSDVLTEGCSNAVRHGKATRVAIRISEESDACVRVHMSDNGRALPATEVGMGSRLLDAVAISWDRTTQDDGTVLAVLLPVQQDVG